VPAPLEVSRHQALAVGVPIIQGEEDDCGHCDPAVREL
jgi:hypothetical protein